VVVVEGVDKDVDLIEQQPPPFEHPADAADSGVDLDVGAVQVDSRPALERVLQGCGAPLNLGEGRE
jgi:hypothetical protein